MIRHSLPSDQPALARVYAAAREIMRRSGNPTQWGDSRPDPARIEQDIESGAGYVLEDDGGVYGAFALLFGEDPTYAVIDGAWPNDKPYATLHRIASDGTHRGVLAEILAFCDAKTDTLRIDTHENNRIMRHMLEKAGFVPCGTIRLENGDPRLAFQKERGA